MNSKIILKKIFASLIYAAIFYLGYQSPTTQGRLFRLSNGFFTLGMAYLIYGLALYVKKTGFFKTIKYQIYLKRCNQESKEALPFHEFVEIKYSQQHIDKKYFVAALFLITLAVIIPYLI